MSLNPDNIFEQHGSLFPTCKVFKIVVRCVGGEEHFIIVDLENNKLSFVDHPDMGEDLLNREKVLSSLSGEPLNGCFLAYKSWLEDDPDSSPVALRPHVLSKIYTGLPKIII